MELEFVTKRNGEKQPVDWAKVDGRLNHLNSYPVQLTCNASFVSHRVHEMGIENGMDTKLLDERAAKVAAELASHNPDFLTLSARISVSNHHKNTFDCFSSTMDACYRNRKPVGDRGVTKSAPRINVKLYKFAQLHKNKLNRMIDYDRDYRFTDFGFATLMDRYLIKRSGPKAKVEARPQDYAIERPQDMWMRVACSIHMNRNNLADNSVLDAVKETYDMLSLGKIMHATPTLYNAGTQCEQLLSCYLVGGSDSIEAISKLEGDLKKLSKYAGGIGFHWPLRSSGSEVSSTNGTSDGPIPFLRCIEASMKAVNQGGKRTGSAANYEDPAHPDTMAWLRLKRHNEPGAIDKLFYALWIHDEFMKRVEADELWYFVDPHEHPELYGSYGEEYSRIYNQIVAAGETRGEPVQARRVLMEACRTQAEGGMPYMLFADHINRKSNQKNIGTIRSSNLCAEIVLYSSPEEYACCAVSSICLNAHVVPCDCSDVQNHQQGCNGTHRVDYDDIARSAAALTRNLNKITDINFYPVPETRRSQLRHRPLAVGVQGLADLFHIMRYPFESASAQAENKRIFESIYYGCMRQSIDLAKEDGAYESFLGDALNNPDNPDEPSPFSQGIFQFDMWGVTPDQLMGKWDWDQLKADAIAHGVRNSQLTALPPTASTSHIQGNTECLHGSTPITLSSGIAIPIEKFCKSGDIVIGWDGKNMKQSNQSNKIDQGIRETITLTFIDGRTICCTPDHKFLLNNGTWIEAQNINKDHSIVAGVEGTLDEIGDDECGYKLETSVFKFSMDNEYSRRRTLAFARILGYVLTDGHISYADRSPTIVLYMGTIFDVNAIAGDIMLLEGKYPRVRDYERCYRIYLNAQLCRTIVSLDGIVFGKRSTNPASLPVFLNTAPVSVVREFLAGMMGGDGIMPFISKESTFRSPKLELSIHRNHIESLHKMFQQLSNLFTKVGIPNTEISGPFEKSVCNVLGNPDMIKLRLTIPNGTAFHKYVGVRYCINKLYRLSVATMYWRQKENIARQRKYIIDHVLSDEPGSVIYRLERARDKLFNQEAAISPTSYVSKDDIKYYKKIGGYKLNTRNRSDISPIEFIRNINAEFVFQDYSVKRNTTELPNFTIGIIAVTKSEPSQVWDISVDDTHSFLAAGVMVHNCFEAVTDNIYVRKTLSGENLVVNHHLVRDLVRLNLWNPAMRGKIIAARGSVQEIAEIPEDIREQYKSVWEMDNRVLIDMDAARGPFIDQTQSSNRFMAVPTAKKLFSMHLRCWKRGLKTGMYYLRSLSKSKATQFSESAKRKTRESADSLGDSNGSLSESSSSSSSSSSENSPSLEENMMCVFKKENGIACFTCQ